MRFYISLLHLCVYMTLARLYLAGFPDRPCSFSCPRNRAEPCSTAALLRLFGSRPRGLWGDHRWQTYLVQERVLRSSGWLQPEWLQSLSSLAGHTKKRINHEWLKTCWTDLPSISQDENHLWLKQVAPAPRCLAKGYHWGWSSFLDSEDARVRRDAP